MPQIASFQDLVAWQLAMQLADLVDALVLVGPASRNESFCDQIQKSSSKPSAQIAEGFLRFKPRESAYYYRIARASLGETQTHLIRGYRRGYWSADVFQKAWDVSQGALKTTTGLLNSRLERIKQEEEEKRRRRPKRDSPHGDPL
jgi:four helix bundle protein